MRLVTVASFDYPFQAHLAAAQLEDAGIPCMLADEHAIGIHPFYSQALGGVKVRVPEDRAQEASALLTEPFDEATEEVTCPACGSADVSHRHCDPALSLLTSLVFLIGLLPLTLVTAAPVPRRRYVCGACGRKWREDESVADGSGHDGEQR